MFKYKKLFYPIIAVLIAFLIGYIVLLGSKDPLASYKMADLIWGNFRSKPAFLNFLGYFAVYSLVGVAVAFGFKGNIFNIGVSGQMMFAGTISYIAVTWGNSKILNPVVILVLCILAAMTLGMFTILLKIYGNIHEVVSTIMLNWAVLYFYQFILEMSPKLANDGASLNLPLNLLINLNVWGVVTSTFNIGVFIVIFLIFGFWALFRFTSFGYKIKIVGINPRASKYVGVKNKQVIIYTMLISSAIAGLAGFVYYYGIKRFIPVQSLPLQIGFDGITVSLLASNNFIGIIFSALFVSSIYTQKIVMSGNKEIVDTIIAIALLTIAVSSYFLSKSKLKITSWYLQIIAKREMQLQTSYHGLRNKYLLILLIKDRFKLNWYLLINKLDIYYEYLMGYLIIGAKYLFVNNKTQFLLEKLALNLNKQINTKKYYQNYQELKIQKNQFSEKILILKPKKLQKLAKINDKALKKITKKIKAKTDLIVRLIKKVQKIDRIQQKKVQILNNRCLIIKQKLNYKENSPLRKHFYQFTLNRAISKQQKQDGKYENKRNLLMRRVKEEQENA